MDIFISYASEQRAIAEEIALALREEGHEPFFDRSELPDGDAYNARIREAISDSDLLVFLVSPEAVSAGRYTLTELRFAEDKWRSPAGRVLPVMVRPTDSALMPAYLRAVVVLRPAGSASAEVVAAVERLSRPAWMRVGRRVAIGLIVLAVIGGGFGAWRAIEHSRTCGQALPFIQEAKLLQGARDFSAAWDSYNSALAACPSSEEASVGKERLAMDWLEHIRVTEGKETFTDIVNKVQPALSTAAVSKDNKRAADALAHLGWSDFLRSRDGQGGLDPVPYYQQALSRDPQNPYAHAFWGHYLMAEGGDPKQAKEHFDKALASNDARQVARSLEIAAYLWRSDPELENEAIRIVNDMRLKGEPSPAVGAEHVTSQIWNIYYSRLVWGHDKASFLEAVPAKENLATFLWLLTAYDNSSNGQPYRFMLAQLQEQSGDRADALKNYESLVSSPLARGARRGSMYDVAKQAVLRLQKP